jgi:hypothetical protein
MDSFIMRRISACALAALTVCSAVACGPAGTDPSTTTTYTGTFSGQMIVTTTTGATVCISTRTLNGTVRVTLTQPSSSTNLTGTGAITGTLAETSIIPAGSCPAQQGSTALNVTRPISGTATNLAFSSSTTATPTPIGTGSLTCTDTTVFTGTLVGSAITGTLTYGTACTGTNGISNIAGSGTTAIPVALR